MRVDLDQATGDHFSADICIVGAGIAGLTLANRLSGSGLNIALLEGGGLTPEERSQELYAVEMAGVLHEGATKGRFRLFGGSSTQWGGQLLAYPDDVFNPPANLNMKSWPVQSPELEPYYAEILKTFGVPVEPFQTGSLASGGIESPPAADADVAVRFSRWAPFTQRNLAATLGKQCLADQAVTVYLHANVTRLERAESGDRIKLVNATSFSGKTVTFSAPAVVVCLGVIESTRLLLASGIDGDPVGRYFHDHIGVHAATLQLSARAAAIRLFAPRVRGAVLYTPKLEATAKWRQAQGTQAVMAHFPIVEPDDSAVATIRMLLQGLQRKRLPDGWLGRVFSLPAGMSELARLAYSSQVLKRRALSKRAEYRLNIDVEQMPLPESRITLSSSQKDRFGVPLARLDWKISQAEGRTVHLFAQLIRGELQALNVQPVTMNPALASETDDWLSIAADTYHMMGGTRMGVSSADSVVDSNLKVHDIQNLYVASCSVFPTGGSSNPTFTMMALTLRLAEMLKTSQERMKSAVQ